MTLAAETAIVDTQNAGWIVNTSRTDLEYWASLPQSRPKYKRLENSTAQPEPLELESSTAPPERADEVGKKAEIRKRIEALFGAAKEEFFEDGMESEFSRGLVSLVRQYSNRAIDVLVHLLGSDQVNAEVASEALRWLGRMDHPPSYYSRLWLLERSLRCSSARVRDGAALGLSFLDDPDAITYLKQTIEREPVEELRRDMEQVLAQLESTRLCRLS